MAAQTQEIISFSAIEQVLVHGDLAALNVEQRVQYHNLVCKSLGLNPLTRPFNFLVLNGKTVLYATRDCTDQLRKINTVSILSLDRKLVGDLIVVTVSARDKQERMDFATGVVNTKGLVGGDLANAMMKAETKAKRRVTLSLCGLGVLDESEVEPDEEVRTGAVQRESGAAPLPSNGVPKALIPQTPIPQQPSRDNTKVYVQVLKHYTVISGTTYFMRDNSKMLGATFDTPSKSWRMPAGRTHELLALCEKLKLVAIEIDESGKEVIDIEPQVPGLEQETMPY